MNEEEQCIRETISIAERPRRGGLKILTLHFVEILMTEVEIIVHHLLEEHTQMIELQCGRLTVDFRQKEACRPILGTISATEDNAPGAERPSQIVGDLPQIEAMIEVHLQIAAANRP